MASFNENDDDSNVKDSGWFINLFTGNLSPLTVVEPSNTFIDNFHILKYGICGKSNSKNTTRFKERYTFLLPGRIVLAYKGHSNPDTFTQRFDLNVKPKYVIYLSPYVNVSRSRNVITLEYYSSNFSVP